MIDLYSRIILTIIAIALSSIALQMSVGSARAVGDSCSGSFLDPCVVEVKGGVRIDKY